MFKINEDGSFEIVRGDSASFRIRLYTKSGSGTPTEYINKPSIPTKLTDFTNDGNFVQDVSYVHTDSNFTSAEKTKLSGIATGDYVAS